MEFAKKDLGTYSMQKLMLMANYYEVPFSSKKQLIDRLAIKIHSRLRRGNMNLSDCVNSDDVDIITTLPFDPEKTIMIERHCYDIDGIKRWIDMFKNKTDFPTSPLTNLKIKWKYLEELGYSNSDFPHTWQKDFNYWIYKVVENSWSLQFVPEELQTLELYKIAVTNNGRALEFVPDSVKTEELCKIAVSNYGLALQFVPNSLKTPEICKIAVNNYESAIKFVPDSLKTEELCKIAVTQFPIMLEFVPDSVNTLEICKIAVTKNGYMLRYVPMNLRTEEICKLAVTQYGLALVFVPDSLRTLEICKLALIQNKNAIQYVPEELKTFLK